MNKKDRRTETHVRQTIGTREIRKMESRFGMWHLRTDRLRGRGFDDL
jgi:hypothetical protein